MVFQQLVKIPSIHSFKGSIAKITRPIYVLQDLKACTIVARSFAMAAWSNVFFENLLCGVIKMWKDVFILKVIKPSSFISSLSVCSSLSLYLLPPNFTILHVQAKKLTSKTLQAKIMFSQKNLRSHKTYRSSGTIKHFFPSWLVTHLRLQPTGSLNFPPAILMLMSERNWLRHDMWYFHLKLNQFQLPSVFMVVVVSAVIRPEWISIISCTLDFSISHTDFSLKTKWRWQWDRYVYNSAWTF